MDFGCDDQVQARAGRVADTVALWTLRAADLYAQGWTLRQIGAELGVHWSTTSEQLQRSGISMRSSGAPANPASTKQILELRDQVSPGMRWQNRLT